MPHFKRAEFSPAKRKLSLENAAASRVSLMSQSAKIAPAICGSIPRYNIACAV
jgi:hypothetical protein